ncbi:MAG: hypothetical protein L3J29_01800 [Cyclobacteriaceae bacterium]|nr:hypothetical protein [Cyclobacteriaceae bacterium]
MIIARNKLGTTFYYKEEMVLLSVYKGRISIDVGLEHLASIVEFYKSNEVLGSVVDIKKMYGSFAKIFEYMKTTYYPFSLKSGLKCQAFVVSEDLIINNLSSKLQGLATSFNLESKVFQDRTKAMAWVKSNI